MRRLFAGFLLPERPARRLAEESEKLRGAGARVAWAPPELLHVTLRFLGDVGDDRTEDACALVRTAAAGFAPLRLVAVGLGFLPAEGPPRVVRVGVRGESPADEARFRDLRGALNDGARLAGFRPEKGEFEPHVTLGRIREPEDVGRLVEKAGPAARREFAHFRVDAITLFESDRVDGASAYVPLAVARLGRRS